MQKKQWFALGIMFMVFSWIFMYIQIAYWPWPSFLNSDISDIAIIAYHTMYAILIWFCSMAWIGCWICGLLEKE